MKSIYFWACLKKVNVLLPFFVRYCPVYARFCPFCPFSELKNEMVLRF